MCGDRKHTLRWEYFDNINMHTHCISVYDKNTKEIKKLFYLAYVEWR